MRAHIRRVRCIVKFFIVSSIIFIFISIIILKKTSISKLTDVDKCPACYGTNLCPLLNSGKIHLNVLSTWFNAKNVYFANSPLGEIVLKKLGHAEDLYALDKFLCELINIEDEDCPVQDLIWKLQDVKTAMFNYIQSNYAKIKNGLIFCPAVNPDQLDDLLDRFISKAKGVGYKTLLINIFTMMIINPEPIILEAFPAIDGWPFPKYHGACGRLAVEENTGTRIHRYLDSPWHLRANIAFQLLQIARQLTFQDQRYALYLTDISLDNVVMDQTGKLSVIDLGNVILLDKYPPAAGRGTDWNKMHVSEKLENDGDCEECFVYSSDDVCAHKISDHNYYAICQFLAQHNWLHNPPGDVTKLYPQLESLLSECLNPEMENGRYIAVRHIIPILANLTAAIVTN